MNASSICFVINAKSHRVARHGSWLKRASSATTGIQVLLIEDFTTLGQDISEMAQRGGQTFFIEGGDGTVLAVLSACADHADKFDTPPEFAILPGGSTNLAYKIVGFRARNARAFRKRLDAILEGAPTTCVDQQALSVRCDTLPSPVIGFVLSTGTLARAMSYVQREFHGEGHRGSVAVAKAIFRFWFAPHKYLDRDEQLILRGSHLSLRAEDIAYDGAHCLSLATSLPRLSLGINPFWGADYGGISVTYARWPLPHFRSGLIEAILWKRPGRLAGKGFTSHRAEQIELQPDDPIMIDGEVFNSPPGSKVTITLTEPIGFLR